MAEGYEIIGMGGIANIMEAYLSAQINPMFLLCEYENYL